MSNRLFNLARDIPLPTSQKFVLLVLCDYANKLTSMAWPSVGTLSKITGFSDRTVQSALRCLTKAGHISPLLNPGRVTKYIVHPRSEFGGQDGTRAMRRGANPCREPRRKLNQRDELAAHTPEAVSPEPPLTVIEPPITAVSPEDPLQLVSAAANLHPQVDKNDQQRAILQGWLMEGFSLDLDILPIIEKAVADRPGPTTSLTRFDGLLRNRTEAKFASAGRSGKPSEPRFDQEDDELLGKFRRALSGELGQRIYTQCCNDARLERIAERNCIRISGQWSDWLKDGQFGEIVRSVARAHGFNEVW